MMRLGKRWTPLKDGYFWYLSQISGVFFHVEIRHSQIPAVLLPAPNLFSELDTNSMPHPFFHADSAGFSWIR